MREAVIVGNIRDGPDIVPCHDGSQGGAEAWRNSFSTTDHSGFDIGVAGPEGPASEDMTCPSSEAGSLDPATPMSNPLSPVPHVAVEQFLQCDVL